MSKLSKVFSIVTILLSVIGFVVIMVPSSETHEIRVLQICYGFALAIIPYIISRSIKDLT